MVERVQNQMCHRRGLEHSSKKSRAVHRSASILDFVSGGIRLVVGETFDMVSGVGPPKMNVKTSSCFRFLRRYRGSHCVNRTPETLDRIIYGSLPPNLPSTTL